MREKKRRFFLREHVNFWSVPMRKGAVKLGVSLVMLLSTVLYRPPLELYSAPQVWPAPVILNPTFGETATVENYPPGAIPYFEWEPVSGAATYRIQIDDQIGFNEPLLYNQTTPNNRYIPYDNDDLIDGIVYWRVRVETPVPVGEWAYGQFTKDWGTTGNAPVLLYPEQGATIEFFERPVFSWTPVIGAADYVLKIDNDPDCSTPLNQYTTLATSYNPSTRLVNGNYYWCVTPRDPASRNGLTSEIRSMNVVYAQTPQLLAPEDFSMPVYTPVFHWTAVKGAASYRLQYSTDPTFVASLTTVTTDQTTYTPLVSFPNDQTFYWRVAAIYGTSYEGPYCEAWRFEKKWVHQPVLLTPRNNELTNVPLFTWTPVREARRYRFEASFDPGFATTAWPPIETANTFHWQDRWDGDEWGQTMYWRVIPYDQNGNDGVSSEVRSFRPVYTTAMPENIWPRYFYSPPSIPSGNYAPPYDIPISYDYTVDTPTFYWSRTFVPAADPREEAAYYRLEVDNSSNFGSPEWTVLTENLSATPTEGNPFTPTAATNYYWRVTPYGSGGALLSDSLNNQPWMTQIDVSRQITPTATSAPTLLSPAPGEKVFETMPSFEWKRQQGAVRYELAISADPAFASTDYATRTTYACHTPVVRLPIGTYFWRVRGLDSNNATVGTWSETRRVVEAMQTRWLGVDMYTLGSLPSQYSTLLALDVDDGLGATELTSLHTAQDKDNWFVGFHINPTLGTQVVYGLYVDTNQKDAQGATLAPPDHPTVTTSGYYQPEHALYVTYNGATLDTTIVPLYDWITHTLSWGEYRNLVDIGAVGGAIYYSSTLGYVELQIPKTAIGDRGDKPFSLSAALFSATSDSATTASDTVPDNGHATSVLTEFKTIADRATLAVPVGGLAEERPQLPYSPYVYAEMPNTDYLGGYKVEVARDPAFTTILQALTTIQISHPYQDVFQYVFTTKSIYEDSTLYWRYAIKHAISSTGGYYAPPSEPHMFTKSGLIPGSLHVEGSYSTPRFVWNAVEGAGNYRFELAVNPNFSPLLHYAIVNHESYTPLDAYDGGTYYWRVRASNSQSPNYSSEWSPISTLNITLPQVSLVEPVMGGVVHSTPRFTWDTVVIPGTTQSPGWSAPKSRLQVSSSPNFSPIYEDIVLDTISWTPTKTYPDGDYYWRVATRDASNHDGAFSSVYTFTKQYPVVRLVAPITGTMTGDPFPTFIWEPVTTTAAASYRIEIAQNPQFSPLTDYKTTDNNRFTPIKKYAAAQYYWRVAMIDKSGKYGPWTDSVVLIDPYPYDIFLPLVLRDFGN
jgi:hypothetical protein